MLIQNVLQRHIARRTNSGELIVNFLVDAVEGKHHDAKYHHKLEAAKFLSHFGSSDEDAPNFLGLLPTSEELAEKQREENPPLPQGDGWGEGESHPRAATTE